MISLQHRTVFAVCLAIVLVSLGLACSRSTTTPNPREELSRSLKGANVDGYIFATEEDDAQVTSSLTNSAVRNLIKLDSGTTNLALRYTSVKDKKANTTRTYKTEVTKAGNALTLQVTDIATGEVVSKNTFPAPQPHNTGAAPPTFDTLEDCIKDFNCKFRGALQCEADRTCRDQFAALTCCLKNGQCFSVHLIIKPIPFRCSLTGTTANLEGLVVSQ
jgi:hypothetical protein